MQSENEQTRHAWDANAQYWDEKMGEGNDFVQELIRPSTERLLSLKSGEKVLDMACGNGLASRRLASLGANVVAFDFSEKMIQHARARTTEYAERIRWHVADATDEDRLLDFGERTYDAILCNMALFDIADIQPLARVIPRLLRPGGRFVFSVIHPCFNNPSTVQFAERVDREGNVMMEYGVKITGYATSHTAKQAAIPGQPEPQLLFHRSLQELLGTFLEQGLLLDALEERAFAGEQSDGKHQIGWNANYREIPPVLVARMVLR